MNPMTNMKNVKKLSEQELARGSKSSWHDQYKDSAWVFLGGLPYDLTEGDIICIFSQYGEVVNLNLIRAKDTGKSKGFCFLCYEDQRSTVLAVDNFNGIKILNRTIRVDHVAEYKVPKEGKNTDDETKKLYAEGCAPKSEPIAPSKIKAEAIIKSEPRDVRETIADQIEAGMKLPPRLPIYTNIKKEMSDEEKSKKKKKKSKKKSKKKHKKSKHSDSDPTDQSSSEGESSVERKDRNIRNSPESKKSKSASSASKDSRDNWTKNRRREKSRSRSRERDDTKRYKREASLYIPKRYR